MSLFRVYLQKSGAKVQKISLGETCRGHGVLNAQHVGDSAQRWHVRVVQGKVVIPPKPSDWAEPPTAPDALTSFDVCEDVCLRGRRHLHADVILLEGVSSSRISSHF